MTLSIEHEIRVEAEVSSQFDQYDTQDIRQKDIDHFVHPWTDFETFHEQGSLVVAESEGAYIFDSDGRRYLDGIGGLWCVNAGYGRAEIGQAMAEQATRIPTTRRLATTPLFPPPNSRPNWPAWPPGRSTT